MWGWCQPWASAPWQPVVAEAQSRASGNGVRGDSLSQRIPRVWLEATRGATGGRPGRVLVASASQAPSRALRPPHLATQLRARGPQSAPSRDPGSPPWPLTAGRRPFPPPPPLSRLSPGKHRPLLPQDVNCLPKGGWVGAPVPRGLPATTTQPLPAQGPRGHLCHGPGPLEFCHKRRGEWGCVSEPPHLCSACPHLVM